MTDEALVEESKGPQLERGTYEVIRKRLTERARELTERLDLLNAARKETFGAIETKLIGNERVTTDNNCTPRDMVSIGSRFIFGYNVHMGLRTETNLEDVFAVYDFVDGGFQHVSLDLMRDARFEGDFKNLYKYYKKTRFAKFKLIGPHLFMKFRVGDSLADFKTFKWLVTDGVLRYVDNRSDHEFVYPPQHEFEWVRTRRDWFRMGAHPHISIEDRVFVETVGGDLTIKVEDNTDVGHGILDEPVDHPDQTLDDAEVYYASVGPLILLEILPYQEKAWRYYVYNEKLQEAHRVDALQDACVLLPDGHGLIFPKGYYLITGELKTFDNALSDMTFEQRIASANGEDFLYVFYNRASGDHILLSYNLIAQKVETPIICNGFSFFEDGTMLYFRTDPEPTKHHAVQIWQTPYTGPNYKPPAQAETALAKIGNKDIVRCMAECHEVLVLLGKEDSYANLYTDIVKKVTGILDSYFWLDREEAGNPREALTAIRETANSAIEEYEKVTRIRKATAEELRRVAEKCEASVAEIRRTRFEEVGDFVRLLAELRVLRGEIISCGERRYVDETRVEALEEEVAEHTESLSGRCVAFLLQPDALEAYAERLTSLEGEIDGVAKVSAAREIEEGLDQTGNDLELLIEIVSNLKIDDATETTRIIDGISALYSDLNRVKSAIKNRKQALARVEGVAEFNAQMKLLSQGLINYLDICDTPDKCETYLTKMTVQLEELEGRFADLDEFIEQLTEKREEIYNAFEAKRLQLLEARNRKVGALYASAERILKGIKSRISKMTDVSEINGYFAGDLMVDKVRSIIEELTGLDDSVKADDLQSRLKTAREEAVRQLTDRKDLFEEGGKAIRLGNHRFSVNNLTLSLTTVMREGRKCFHLAGTNFFEEITDTELLATAPVWDMEVSSENGDVYRGEYLAYRMLRALEGGAEMTIEEAAALDDEALSGFVQRFMGPRFAEGYAKGVHDHDGAVLLRALLAFHRELGLLVYPPRTRAAAQLFWHRFCAKAPMTDMLSAVTGLRALEELFPGNTRSVALIEELTGLIDRFLETSALFGARRAEEAATFLFRTLIANEGFPVSKEAGEIYRGFRAYLDHRGYADRFEEALTSLEKQPVKGYHLCLEWVNAYIAAEQKGQDAFAEEVAALLLTGDYHPGRVADMGVITQLTDLRGNHPRIAKGGYTLDYNRFLERLDRFAREVSPVYAKAHARERALTKAFAEELRLSELEPRVLTSFVRNKLLNQVYLPLIGDNLAKQIGTTGAGTRTDRMGLLLLVSPPGYGKTTLMEYIANRLGLVFMKINGPALGHEVTSLDPASARHASAREELAKLSLAFEMGDNVMIYLDDIQHTNPELLQKFISLCDAQRKIEGVYKGRSRTYDFRGKKVCVVMAGNPYTESGEKFRIPDMLANRADTYNLGDIIGDNGEAFALSYIENALTSNPVLNKLAGRDQTDVYNLIRIAETGNAEGVDLIGNYTREEMAEIVDVLKKLFRVRDVILAVNLAYIQSAAMEDAYRTEPAFKLQGSYRNMNKIAEKVLPILREDELEGLIHAHYENEAQTLTSGAEANLLKFRELCGTLADEDAARWEEIKRTFRKRQSMHGVDEEDKVGRVILQLAGFREGLEEIRDVLTAAARERKTIEVPQPEGPAETLMTLTPSTLDQLRALMEPLMASMAQSLATATPEKPERKQETRASTEIDPRFLYKVIRQQFNVMQHWLKPMYETTQTSDKTVADLNAAVNNLMQTHGALLNFLQQFQDRKKP